MTPPRQGVVELDPEALPEPLTPAGGVLLLDELDEELLSGGGMVAEPDIEPDAEPLSLPGADELGGGGAARLPVAPVDPLLLYESVPDVRGWSVLSPQAVSPPRASTAAAAIKVLCMSISFGE